MIVSATSNFMGNKLSCPFKVGAQDYYCSKLCFELNKQYKVYFQECSFTSSQFIWLLNAATHPLKNY